VYCYHLDLPSFPTRRSSDLASDAGVRLALEFQSRSSFANNLQTAAALVAQCDSPSLGLCFDLFHYYLGPSKYEDLGYLSADNLRSEEHTSELQSRENLVCRL